MGRSRSGKSSVLSTICQKSNLNLKDDYRTCPPQLNHSLLKQAIFTPFCPLLHLCEIQWTPEFFYISDNGTTDDILRACRAIVFVINVKEKMCISLTSLKFAILTLCRHVTSPMVVDVYLHQVDGVMTSWDHRFPQWRTDVQAMVDQDLRCWLSQQEGAHDVILNCYLTSRTDTSVVDAFKTLLVRLAPPQVNMGILLDAFVQACKLIAALVGDRFRHMVIGNSAMNLDPDFVRQCCALTNPPDRTRGTFPFQTRSPEVYQVKEDLVMCCFEITPRLDLICFMKDVKASCIGLIQENYPVLYKGLEQMMSASLDTTVEDSGLLRAYYESGQVEMGMAPMEQPDTQAPGIPESIYCPVIRTSDMPLPTLNAARRARSSGKAGSQAKLGDCETKPS